jgi:hypothetical protein
MRVESPVLMDNGTHSYVCFPSLWSHFMSNRAELPSEATGALHTRIRLVTLMRDA